MTSDIYESVIRSNSNLKSTSLEHLHLNRFDLSYDTTNISNFNHLKTLHLEGCTIHIDYFIAICKTFHDIVEVNVSIMEYPIIDQLIEIVRFANKLEKLVFPDLNPSETTITDTSFLRLAQVVRNRPTKIFISLGSERYQTKVKTFTETNIEFQYTYRNIVGNEERDEE